MNRQLFGGLKNCLNQSHLNFLLSKGKSLAIIFVYLFYSDLRLSLLQQKGEDKERFRHLAMTAFEHKIYNQSWMRMCNTRMSYTTCECIAEKRLTALMDYEEKIEKINNFDVQGIFLLLRWSSSRKQSIYAEMEWRLKTPPEKEILQRFPYSL